MLIDVDEPTEVELSNQLQTETVNVRQLRKEYMCALSALAKTRPALN